MNMRADRESPSTPVSGVAKRPALFVPGGETRGAGRRERSRGTLAVGTCIG